MHSINDFLLTGYIIALASRDILRASAVKLLTIIICVHGCISCARAQSFLLSIFGSDMPP